MINHLGWVVLIVLFVAAKVGAEPLPFTGVNLAGGEFYNPKRGVTPIAEKNFHYPTQSDFEYFSGKGMNLFRVCFRWETLQPELQKPFVAEEMKRLKDSVTVGTSKKLIVILDPHNYARHFDKVVGSKDVTNEDFADFWRQLSIEFKDDPYVWFDLVNEPHSMPTKQWFDAAQAAIDAIRAGGVTNMILVPGNAWSGAHSWTGGWYGGMSNGEGIQSIKDPLDYWAIDVHQYFDKDSSGTTDVVVSPTVGSERLKKFVEWARINKKQAILGEFATATKDPNAPLAVADMLASMERDRDVWLGWTWWAGGGWWGDDWFTVQPKADGSDRPQFTWLMPFAHGPSPVTYKLKIRGGAEMKVETAATHPIEAAVPDGMQFLRWAGDTAWLKDPKSARTEIVMPFRDVLVEPVFVGKNGAGESK